MSGRTASPFLVVTLAALAVVLSVAAAIFLLSAPALLWLAAAFAVVAHQVLYIRGMFSAKSDFFFRSVRGRDYFRGKPGVLFRFDDGPDPLYTPRVLDILKAEGWQALFAVTGENAEKYPDLVRRIAEEGHEIANHTYSHPYFILLMGYRRVREEIERANAAISRITGQPVKYFCPPVGHKNPVIGRAVRDLGMIPVMWDVRTLDTRVSAGTIVQRIRRRMKPPSIILMHDAVLPWGRKDREATLAALREIAGFLREKTY